MKNRRLDFIIHTVMLCAIIFFAIGPEVCALQYAGIVKSNLKLRESPATDAAVVTLLKKDDKVVILKARDAWFQVVVENDAFGYKGWVFGEHVEKKEALAQTGKAAGVLAGFTKAVLPEQPGAMVPSAPTPAPANLNQPVTVELPQTLFAAVAKLEAVAQEFSKWESNETTVTEEVIGGEDNSHLRSFPVLVAGIILVGLVFLLGFVTWQFARITRTVQIQLNSIKGHVDEVKANLKGTYSKNLKEALVEANFVINNRAYGGFIHNISDGGAFIETRESFSLGERVTLTYQDYQANKHVKKNGQIVRIDPRGIAVQFSSLSPPSRP